MHDPIILLREQISQWLNKACQDGWLNDSECHALDTHSLARPDDLFENNETSQRPIVAALFGGTGVGKSTLLNRLAKSPIARAGIVRPTSRELTMYVHEQTPLAQLPEAAPVQRIALSRHTNEEYQNIAWIDMPDIDSTDQANRELALSWLNYVDLVIYVVSPERYRDDRGWQVLQQRGQQHAWIFIMNHWDQGDPIQREDFRQILIKAGFSDPLVLVTCSTENCATVRDELTQLHDYVCQLLGAQPMQVLRNRSDHTRLQTWHTSLQKVSARFGDEKLHQTIAVRWQQIWKETQENVMQGLRWPMLETGKQIAEQVAPRKHKLLQHFTKSMLTKSSDATTPASTPTDTRYFCARVWEPWAQNHVDHANNEFQLAVQASGLRTILLQPQLARIGEQAGEEIITTLSNGVNEALLHPDGKLRQGVRKILGVFQVLLPTIVVAWTAYYTLNAYQEALFDEGEFLGFEFLTHSAILLLLAWLLPFLFAKLFRPSFTRAAQRGLHDSLAQALEQLGQRFLQVLSDHSLNAKIFSNEATEMLLQIEQTLENTKSDHSDPIKFIDRTLK